MPGGYPQKGPVIFGSQVSDRTLELSISLGLTLPGGYPAPSRGRLGPEVEPQVYDRTLGMGWTCSLAVSPCARGLPSRGQ